MCIVYLAVEGQKGREEVYRSKLPRGNYDTQLKEMVKLPFKFEEQQNLVFEVYKGYSDCDTPSPDDLRGTLQTPLATVNTKGKVRSCIIKDARSHSLRGGHRTLCYARSQARQGAGWPRLPTVFSVGVSPGSIALGYKAVSLLALLPSSPALLAENNMCESPCVD